MTILSNSALFQPRRAPLSYRRTALIALFSGLFALSACHKSLPDPAAGQDSQGDDGVIAATEDSSAASADAAIVGDTGSAASSGDVGGSGDVGDDSGVAGLDVGSALDQDVANDAAGIAPLPLAVTNVVPGPYCPGALPGLPMPGQPCTTLGDVRCTNFGQYSTPQYASWAGYGVAPEVANGSCVRPNKVRCSQVNQKRVWVLEACQAQAAPAYCGVAKHPHSCQENEKGVSCCPLVCYPGNAPPAPGLKGDAGGTGPYNAVMCPSTDAGKVRCRKGGVENGTCTFPNGTPAVKAMNAGYFTDCSALCKGCTYWFRSTICPERSCKKTKNQKYPEGIDHNSGLWSWPSYILKCYADTDLTGKCNQTCEDEGMFAAP